MARPLEATREKAIDAARKGFGKTTVVAGMLGVTPQTVRNYRQRWATFDKAIEESRLDFDDRLLDRAEVKLDIAVGNGEAWAIKYALATKGKKRGYVERQEVTGADGNKIILGWGDDANA